MKLEAFVTSTRLNLTSTDTPLPTIKDVLGHLSCLIDEKLTSHKPGTWSTNELYYQVAADLITLYKNRSLPTLIYTDIVR